MFRPILAAWMLVICCHAAQSVEGQVINSVTGAGIVDAVVALIRLSGEGSSYNARTDSHGRFRIENVKEGTFRATYRATGFWFLPLGVRESIVVASKDESVRLDVKMQPQVKLSGRVFDSDGKPMANAPVWARWIRAACQLPE